MNYIRLTSSSYNKLKMPNNEERSCSITGLFTTKATVNHPSRSQTFGLALLARFVGISCSRSKNTKNHPF